MAQRSLSAALETETLAAFLYPIMLVELEFSGGTVNFWTGLGDLAWDSKTWTGTGNLGSVSTIEEAAELRATGVNFVLSGIPASVISIAFTQNYQGRAAQVWVGALDTTTNKLTGTPYLTFSGKMDTMELRENGDASSITLAAENELIDLERPREFRYTTEDHQTLFSSDTFFDYVPALQDAQIHWGREEFSTKLAPVGNQ